MFFGHVLIRSRDTWLPLEADPDRVCWTLLMLLEPQWTALHRQFWIRKNADSALIPRLISLALTGSHFNFA